MNSHSALIEQDIDAYLHLHEQKDLLRFITCGSVDDGKSTLIGRLLHDAKSVYEDQLAAIANTSKTQGTTADSADLALLVDGLQAEREQGITIDVAYRFFSTERRKFIIADTPGHEQYTRNMATGASTADAAILLIDARYGLQPQTRRHSYLCALLGIRHFVVAINKMDLVGFDPAVFNRIRDDFAQLAQQFPDVDYQTVPISALSGDNLVTASAKMPWYQGAPLLSLLESIEHRRPERDQLRFPIQQVNRPHLDFRGYSGTLAAGTLAVGDRVQAFPNHQPSTITAIYDGDRAVQQAVAGQALTVTLADDIDLSRGDWLVGSDDRPAVGRRFKAQLVWMNPEPLSPGRRYELKIGHRYLSGAVTEIHWQLDINRLQQQPATNLPLNGIGMVDLELSAPVPFDRYQQHRATGSFILIDRLTNATLGAGMITEQLDDVDGKLAPAITPAQRAALKGQRALAVWVADLDLGSQLESALHRQGLHTHLVGVGNDAGERVQTLLDAGLIAVVSGPRRALTQLQQQLAPRQLHIIAGKALDSNSLAALISTATTAPG